MRTSMGRGVGSRGGKGGRDRRKKKLKKSKGREEKILRIGKQT